MAKKPWSDPLRRMGDSGVVGTAPQRVRPRRLLVNCPAKATEKKSRTTKRRLPTKRAPKKKAAAPKRQEYTVGNKKTNPDFATCASYRKELIHDITRDFQKDFKCTSVMVDAAFGYMEHMGADLIGKAGYACIHRKRKTTSDADVRLVRQMMKIPQSEC